MHNNRKPNVPKELDQVREWITSLVAAWEARDGKELARLLAQGRDVLLIFEDGFADLEYGWQSIIESEVESEVLGYIIGSKYEGDVMGVPPDERDDWQ